MNASHKKDDWAGTHDGNKKWKAFQKVGNPWVKGEMRLNRRRRKYEMDVKNGCHRPECGLPLHRPGSRKK